MGGQWNYAVEIPENEKVIGVHGFFNEIYEDICNFGFITVQYQAYQL